MYDYLRGEQDHEHAHCVPLSRRKCGSGTFSTGWRHDCRLDQERAEGDGDGGLGAGSKYVLSSQYITHHC
jgi:hypothetical protein